MGWFTIDEEGRSFCGDIWWGDGAADAMDSFLEDLYKNSSPEDANALELLQNSLSTSKVVEEDALSASIAIQEILREFEEVGEELTPEVLEAGFNFSNKMFL